MTWNKRGIMDSVTMKAAQWDPKQKKVVVNDVPIPEPGKNQFLIKIKSASSVTDARYITCIVKPANSCCTVSPRTGSLLSMPR
ncbi:hypothetical protein BJ546DRAFT_679082 [Cryomyces antarcticus]